jgi:predicted O-methyltransferase YrrM
MLDGVEFLVTPDSDQYMTDTSSPDRFVVAKQPEMVDRLSDVVEELQPRRIVELGIFKGGSAALLALLARPERLTAVELEAEPAAALEGFLDTRELRPVVACHYGVDQADRERLDALVRADHGDEPLDLVVDDASHQLRHTRSSFEVLFPRLRPGGVYLIEDWAWAHFPEPTWQDGGGFWHDQPALTNLIVELMMMVGTRNELIADITITKDIALVRRGTGRVAAPMRLEDHYLNRGLPFRPLL